MSLCQKPTKTENESEVDDQTDSTETTHRSHVNQEFDLQCFAQNVAQLCLYFEAKRNLYSCPHSVTD